MIDFLAWVVNLVAFLIGFALLVSLCISAIGFVTVIAVAILHGLAPKTTDRMLPGVYVGIFGEEE